MPREIIAAFGAKCVGVSSTEIAPLRDSPANPSLIVFKDGTRSLGCSYLVGNGVCGASNSTNLEIGLKCVQLEPAVSRVVFKSTSIFVPKEEAIERPTLPIVNPMEAQPEAQPPIDTVLDEAPEPALRIEKFGLLDPEAISPGRAKLIEALQRSWNSGGIAREYKEERNRWPRVSIVDSVVYLELILAGFTPVEIGERVAQSRKDLSDNLFSLRAGMHPATVDHYAALLLIHIIKRPELEGSLKAVIRENSLRMRRRGKLIISESLTKEDVFLAIEQGKIGLIYEPQEGRVQSAGDVTPAAEVVLEEPQQNQPELSPEQAKLWAILQDIAVRKAEARDARRQFMQATNGRLAEIKRAAADASGDFQRPTYEVLAERIAALELAADRESLYGFRGIWGRRRAAELQPYERLMMTAIGDGVYKYPVLSPRQTELAFDCMRVGEPVERLATLLDFQKEIPETERERFNNLFADSRNLEELLVHANLRLVYYFMPLYSLELSAPDAFQAGIFGLKRAIKRYDPGRGVKFGSYSGDWIRQTMGRARDDLGRAIRLPVHTRDDLRKAQMLVSNFYSAKGFYPEGEDLKRLEEEVSTTIANNLDTMPPPISLDEYVDTDSEEEDTVGDLVVDEQTDVEAQALDRVTQQEVRAVLRGALGRLSARHAGIILDRIVVGKTLQEVGDEQGVTREAIRINQEKALEKLRRDPKLQQLLRELRRN